jgi:hypothetical protein
MFIRKRKTTHGYSYQVIETYREAGKVKQRIIGNLYGFDSLYKAIDYYEKIEKQFSDWWIKHPNTKQLFADLEFKIHYYWSYNDIITKLNKLKECSVKIGMCNNIN